MEEEKDKPAYDEQTLAKLLEAAYVLQEHNRGLRKLELNLELQRDQLGSRQQSTFVPSNVPQKKDAEVPKDDYTVTLAQIVETQHQIQARQLELADAILLIAERLTEIANASGAGVGILDDKKIRYQAGAGSMALPAGTEVAMEKALCIACVRTGQVIRCADVNSEFLLDVEDCQRRGIQSMIAVPVYHDGGVAGGLELYYSTTQAFTEQDVHSCQLMAGLVTEALARDEEVTLKKSLAKERAVMLEALERLKPNLAALVENPAGRTTAVKASGANTASSASAFSCRKCGHQLMAEEQFCGKCGTPRSSDYEAPSMQSKVAALWQMQEAMNKSTDPASANGDAPRADLRAMPDPTLPEKPLADSIEEEMPELFAAPELRIEKAAESFAEAEASETVEDRAMPVLTVAGETDTDTEADPDEHEANPETALARTGHAWTSAAAARDFLEQLAGQRRPGGLASFWNARRGDIYLAIAVLLVAGVIRWGIWSNHSVSATGTPATAAAGHRKPAPDADLSWVDRMLVSLGLAEAPATPEYKGNPETQVWVDLHTALYYCPGTDLYGKTPKGKYTSQKDAQLDQFEPAYRKACD